jgi:hypothetical protein
VAEGRAEGVAEGRAEGVAEGRALALIAFLEARDLTPSDEQRARILACEDAVELGRWIKKAARATSLDDVFDAS